MIHGKLVYPVFSGSSKSGLTVHILLWNAPFYPGLIFLLIRAEDCRGSFWDLRWIVVSALLANV